MGSTTSAEAVEADDPSARAIDARLEPRILHRHFRSADGLVEHEPTTPSQTFQLGERFSVAGDADGKAHGAFVTIMTFNILADCYASASAHPCEKVDRVWRFRRWKILREIEAHMCDFVCLQEVDKAGFRFLQGQLSPLCYAGSWANTGRQGPALFYRVDRFKPLDIQELKLHGAPGSAFVEGLIGEEYGKGGELEAGSRADWLRRRLEGEKHVCLTGTFAPLSTGGDKRPVGAATDGTDEAKDASAPAAAAAAGSGAGVAAGAGGGAGASGAASSAGGDAGASPTSEAASASAPSGPVVTVASTHFQWRPADSDIKTLQAGLLVSSLHAHLKSLGIPVPGSRMAPVFINGDFNSMPAPEVHVCDGVARMSAAVEFFTTGRVSAPAEGAGAVDKATGRPPLEVDALVRMTCPFPDATPSAYVTVLGSAPKYTNYTRNFKDCLDHCFYTPAGTTPLAVLDTPADEVLEAVEGIPSADFPSDHLPLVVLYRVFGEKVDAGS